MHDPKPPTEPPSQLDRISATLQSRNGTALPLSYAQNLEDYHLSLAFAGQPTGTYIDIGGGHPVAGSVSFWFYERGWQGIVVEPQEPLAALHRQVRPRDTVVSGIVSAQSGSATLFVVDRLHALTTTIEAYADNAKNYGADVASITVPAVTLAELCASHGIDAIDFLKIDVEGAEADVIAGGDWRRYRPKVVVVEAIKPLSGEPAGRHGKECCSRRDTVCAVRHPQPLLRRRRASRHPGAPAVAARALGRGQAHVRDRPRRRKCRASGSSARPGAGAWLPRAACRIWRPNCSRHCSIAKASSRATTSIP